MSQAPASPIRTLRLNIMMPKLIYLPALCPTSVISARLRRPGNQNWSRTTRRDDGVRLHNLVGLGILKKQIGWALERSERVPCVRGHGWASGHFVQLMFPSHFRLEPFSPLISRFVTFEHDFICGDIYSHFYKTWTFSWWASSVCFSSPVICSTCFFCSFSPPSCFHPLTSYILFEHESIWGWYM